MKRQLFNDQWQLTAPKGSFGLEQAGIVKTITLPYDAQLFTKRYEQAPYASGCYSLGKWEFKKIFSLPAGQADQTVILQFDGVYQNAMVYVNGEFAHYCSNGYTQFFVDISPFVRWGAENTIKVVINLQDGARWYSGAGIYRDVHLLTAGKVYIPPHGVRISTDVADSEQAGLVIYTTLCNRDSLPRQTLRIQTDILDPQGNVVASRSAPITVKSGQSDMLRQKLWVKNPALWDLDSPTLYSCRTLIQDQVGNILDQQEEPFGIRTFALSPEKGLSINGRQIKLQGCCIHHENGPVGAVSIDSVEDRKITKLKEAGFNAIRTAHNPFSEALLRACDRHGMLVMHEAFDTWGLNKVDFDNTFAFQKNWKDDLKAMVDSSYNHPCVMMYSIGNEIADVGNASGAARGREIAEYLRSLDNTRYVINCINGMVAVMDLLMGMAAAAQEQNAREGQDAINDMMNGLGDQMKAIVTLEIVDYAIEEACTYLDVAGYNYMDSRYQMDSAKYSSRILCGTETFVPTIDQNWKLVKAMPNVIGDFCWTGWDYCGEPGIGLVKHEIPPMELGMGLPFPCLLANTGEFTISGFRRPSSYYHEIVLGQRNTPYIAVQRPENHNGINILTPWSWSDSVSSWSWNGWEGKPVTVEVYSDAEEVELLHNGMSLGRQPTGEDNRFKAIFETVYEPGELTAIAYSAGVEQARYTLTSAKGKAALHAMCEQETYSLSARDMIYIPISAQADNGEVLVGNKSLVQASWEGPVEFMGFGNDEPCPTENFMDHARTLYDGRALLALRPTAAGVAKVHLHTDSLGDTEITIHIGE